MDDIRPLKSPIEISDISLWPFIILVLLIICGALAFIYFKRKRQAEEESLLPPRPPEQIAMEGLQSLLGMKLIEKGLVKEYYIRLSDIVRKYIEERFRISVLDRTTWELYQDMRIKKVKREWTDRIRDLLEDCDLVKFAKYIPSEKEIEQAHTEAKEIVEITSPPSADASATPVAADAFAS